MSDPGCPALVDLLAETTAPEIAEHAGLCARCRGLLESINGRVTPELTQGARVPARDTNPTVGAVTLIADGSGDNLLPAVVLAAGEDGLTVIPVSPEVRFATEWDLLLPDRVLGYPAIAQVWNHGVIQPEQATEHVTQLPTATLQDLRGMLLAAGASGEVPSGLHVGPPVLTAQDPRLVYQDADARRALWFWEPTLALAGALTLGQLVRHRRDELEIPAANIERLAGTDGWLADLEADTLVLPGALPAGVLAATMRTLKLTASGRLARLARWTMEGRSAGTAGALARKGMSGHAPHGEDVDSYIREFMRELEGDGE